MENEGVGHEGAVRIAYRVEFLPEIAGNWKKILVCGCFNGGAHRECRGQLKVKKVKRHKPGVIRTDGALLEISQINGSQGHASQFAANTARSSSLITPSLGSEMS
jgi:hypothetical protein